MKTPLKTPTRTNTHPITQSISFCTNKVFSFFPARVATRKINLGVGVLVQDPMLETTLNLTGVAFASKKMRLEQNLVDCAQ